MGWYLDPALTVLRGQLSARYPGVVIYTIGDEAHSSKVSDHNPDPDGSVDAIDVMLGPKFSRADANNVVRALVKSRDRRIKYIIWDRQIISAGDWVWRKYYGSNPHTDHPHISRNDNHLRDLSLWDITTERRIMQYTTFEASMPLLKQGDSDAEYDGYNMIGRAQELLGLAADGEYGPKTAAAIKALRPKEFSGKVIDEAVYRTLFGLAWPSK